jgi:hypothetical protein
MRNALDIPEVPDLGNEDAGMPAEPSPGKKPTSRRYSSEEKAAVVRMVRALRAELRRQLRQHPSDQPKAASEGEQQNRNDAAADDRSGLESTSLRASLLR